MSDRQPLLTLRLRSWRWRLSIGLLGITIAAAYLLGFFTPADRFLSDLAFSTHARQASGKLVLVEIDPKSLTKLATWPWSRAYHAALMQRLLAAGADKIAFDVDFSASSAPAADQTLAQAIAAAKGRVVLATFSQQDKDALAHGVTATMPLPAFRESATLGLVNMFADSDGGLRHYRLAEDRLAGSPAALAAVLAAPLGSQPNAFAIDYSIAPDSITRLSYVDVLTGRFDAAAIAGKTVLVGANAVELGDRYAVPVHGFLPGVEIQALAFESLVLGRAIHDAGPIWTSLGLALLVAGMFQASTATVRRIHLASLSGALGAVAIGFTAQTVFATAVDTAPWLAMIAGGFLLGVLRHAREQARLALAHRANAARQRALMQGVFNDSFDGILIVDAEGRIELANAAAARLLDLSVETLVGSQVSAHLPGIEAFAENAAVSEIAIQTQAGRDLALAVAVTHSQAVAGYGLGDVRIVTFRDESARRAVEQAREQVLAELEAASLAKNEFLARISHELRTPLSAIIGFSTIISEQSIGPIGNPKYAEYARDVALGGKRLLELVNDIIDVVRIEAGQFEIRPDVFETRSLLMACANQAQSLDDFGGRTLRTEVAPGAEGIQSDRHALSRAIAKLLENAVKFTKPDGEIVLRAVPAPGNGIAIEVRDNGIGIAEKALKNVVGAFSQVAGGLNRSHEGAGLGLHLAYRIMLLLDGRLEIESQVGVGTTVRLILNDAALETSEAA